MLVRDSFVALLVVASAETEYDGGRGPRSAAARRRTAARHEETSRRSASEFASFYTVRRLRRMRKLRTLAGVETVLGPGLSGHAFAARPIDHGLGHGLGCGLWREYQPDPDRAAPPPSTAGVLAGPLCAGDHCGCHDDTAGGDGGAGVPATRRTSGSRSAVVAAGDRATVGSVRLYRTPSAPRRASTWICRRASRRSSCASDPNGAAAAWQIHELGTKTKSYYDTFSFNCGVPGVCSFDELDSAKAEYAKLARNVQDKCGSRRSSSFRGTPATHRIRCIRASCSSGSADVYTWAPWKEHGDPSCGHGRPPGEGSAEGSDAPEKDEPTGGDDTP